MCHGVNKNTKKKTGNWGPGPWNSETVELRNYSETMGLGPWPWNYGITPKFLRNYSETGEPWNSEITPKLGTVELWTYSEITPKLWDWDRGRGTMELLRNYGTGTVAVELWNYSEISPKLLRNWEPWNSEITPKLLRNWGPWNYGITPKLYRNYSETGEPWNYGITPKLY